MYLSALARLGRKVAVPVTAVLTPNQTGWRRTGPMDRFACHVTRTASDSGASTATASCAIRHRGLRAAAAGRKPGLADRGQTGSRQPGRRSIPDRLRHRPAAHRVHRCPLDPAGQGHGYRRLRRQRDHRGLRVTVGRRISGPALWRCDAFAGDRAGGRDAGARTRPAGDPGLGIEHRPHGAGGLHCALLRSSQCARRSHDRHGARPLAAWAPPLRCKSPPDWSHPRLACWRRCCSV